MLTSLPEDSELEYSINCFCEISITIFRNFRKLKPICLVKELTLLGCLMKRSIVRASLLRDDDRRVRLKVDVSANNLVIAGVLFAVFIKQQIPISGITEPILGMFVLI